MFVQRSSFQLYTIVRSFADSRRDTNDDRFAKSFIILLVETSPEWAITKAPAKPLLMRMTHHHGPTPRVGRPACLADCLLPSADDAPTTPLVPARRPSSAQRDACTLPAAMSVPVYASVADDVRLARSGCAVPFVDCSKWTERELSPDVTWHPWGFNMQLNSMVSTIYHQQYRIHVRFSIPLLPLQAVSKLPRPKRNCQSSQGSLKRLDYCYLLLLRL